MAKNDQKVTNTVTTPTNPQWVTDGTKAFADRGTDLLGQDPTKFFAGPQSINQSLFDIAGGLGPGAADALSQSNSLYGKLASSGPNLAGATQATAYGYNPATMTAAQIAPSRGVTGSTAVGGIGQYENPYTDQVVNQTLSDLDRARQMTQNDNGNGAVLAGQFGGSRQGVLDSQANRDFYDRAGAAVGNLRAQGFNTALGAAQTDADRAQQANIFTAGAANDRASQQAQLLQGAAGANQAADNTAWQYNAGANNAASAQNASLGTQNSQFNAGQQDSVYNRILQAAQGMGGLGQFGIGALSDIGGTQQGIAQNQAQSPLSVYGALSGDFSGLPLNLFQGKTTNGTEGVQSGDLSKIGNGLKIGSSVAQTLGSIFSDGRLKRDVETAGYDGKGRRWVDFNYTWDAPDEPKRRGVIAQEVQQTDPDAVGAHPSGFLMVDYSKLEG